MSVEPGDIVIIVRPDDGDKYEVVVDMRDVREWECQSPRNTLRKLAENPSSRDYYALVYAALRRRRGTEGLPAWEDFTRTTVVVPKDPDPVANLRYDELVVVVEAAFDHPDAGPEYIAEKVMALLEALPGREVDPTRPGR